MHLRPLILRIEHPFRDDFAREHLLVLCADQFIALGEASFAEEFLTGSGERGGW